MTWIQTYPKFVSYFFKISPSRLYANQRNPLLSSRSITRRNMSSLPLTGTKRAHDALAETDASGKFVRSAAGFREVISKTHSVFQPEKDRYHLYIAYGCPWANRCLAILKLKGLDDCIGFTAVHPTWQRTRPTDPEDTHAGWVFFDSEKDVALTNPAGFGSFAPAGLTRDTVNGAKCVRDLYEKSNDTKHKYSVPVLWDKKTNSIVNNESSEIVRIFTKEFDEWATGTHCNSKRHNL